MVNIGNRGRYGNMTTRAVATLSLLVMVWAGPSSAGLFGTSWPNIQKAQTQFAAGQVVRAEGSLSKLITKTNDNNYPLTLLNMASVQLSLGDYRQMATYLETAILNLDVELTKTGVAQQVMKSEMSRLYRGFHYEKMLAHTYLGLYYMLQGKNNESRIEFAKVRETDKGKEPGQEDDFAIAHFLDGMNAARNGNYEHARVSFRKVTEMRPGFALGWYALMLASDLDKDLREADLAERRYQELTPSPARMARDSASPCVIFLIENGWGPVRSPDPIVGQFASWNESRLLARRVTIAAVGGQQTDAAQVDNTYFQASTTGGFGQDIAKKLVGAVAKEAASTAASMICPCAPLFMGKSEADVRSWTICPGSLEMAVLPLSEGPTTVTVDAYDARNRHIPVYQQVHYYVSGRPFFQCDPFYIRVVSNANYREEAVK